MDYDENMNVAGGRELARWLTGRPAGYEPSWNVKPTQPLPIAFTDHKSGDPRFEYAFWSLVPVWSKELKTRFPTFNARSETASEKASFKASVKSRRCIIPVTGFYEWTGPKSSRTPHAIFGPDPILPMAGLYSWWHEPDAGDDEGWHLTATILTRASAGILQTLHDRMPVFMSDELLADWLDPETEGDKLLLDAVSEASVPISEHLREYAVKPLRGDGSELIEPA
ncbi:SOS response-associated peptidase [Leucobacter allii]|uniref:Abasic site processing protein n=1 Tax=Leucobacter allii TaxID=2932247 RepID=A0ABY4FLU3_9MICO|nr:SOS response-associated peptidase [Leucobacter allii]UOQ57257.1 SOS response-associated peptidase [Leucobacter allii]